MGTSESHVCSITYMHVIAYRLFLHCSLLTYITDMRTPSPDYSIHLAPIHLGARPSITSSGVGVYSQVVTV